MTLIQQRRDAERGFTLIELMVAVGIIAILSTMAVIQIGSTRSGLRGDAAMRQVISQLSQAREMAVGQRRYIRVTFDSATSRITLVREDSTVATTTLGTIGFEGGAQFVQIAGQGATPDAFCDTQPNCFRNSVNGTFSSVPSSANTIKFAPDGTLVDWNGNATNGTIFMAVPNQPLSSRAVTILGSTGRVKGYRWAGRSWQKV